MDISIGRAFVIQITIHATDTLLTLYIPCQILETLTKSHITNWKTKSYKTYKCKSKDYFTQNTPKKCTLNSSH